MNSNDFDLDTFFDYYEFEFEESSEQKETVSNFNEMLKSKLDDFGLCDEIESSSSLCCAAAERSGFRQGFKFAVKLMKALNRI